MSILENVGWAPMLIGMCVLVGIACWACAFWDSKYRHDNFRSSHEGQFSNSSRRSYVTPRGLT